MNPASAGARTFVLAVFVTLCGQAWAETVPAEVLDLFEPKDQAAAREIEDPSDGVATREDGPTEPLHPETAESALQFLSVYVPYTRAIESEVQERVAPLSKTPGYEKLSSIRKKVIGRHTATYKQAMRLATAHLNDLDARLGPTIEPSRTSIRVSKSRFVVYLMDEAGNRAYAAFPIAYGVHPDRGPKLERGDLRTPESAENERSPRTTPFFAHPLIDDDPAPEAGCITRGIGVSSSDALFDFLDDGWTVMLHGTPDRACIGTRASHGCIRLLPEHIKVLFSYVRDGTPIVIAP